VVGEAKYGHQAVALVKKLHPALVLMDVTLPRLNGLQATCQILKAVPTTKVLMLSAHSEEAQMIEAVNSGAMGHLIKKTSADNVVTAIREIHKGNTFFCQSIPKPLHTRIRLPNPRDKFIKHSSLVLYPEYALFPRPQRSGTVLLYDAPNPNCPFTRCVRLAVHWRHHYGPHLRHIHTLLLN
jgi:DNA-binding NarL/FixJ family response regulator